MTRDNALTDADVRDAAEMLGCEPAAVQAVIDVETDGTGFLDDGRPKILFEAHWFHDLTKGRFDADFPDLSSPEWNPDLYKGGAKEYGRLHTAMGLDARAAVEATSWGLFQILGVNHDLCGFDTPEAFANDQRVSERRHLMAFVRFCRSKGLDRHLANRDWNQFAAGYNGPDYAKHGYHTDLAQAFERHAAADDAAPANKPVLRKGDEGPNVRHVQAMLGAKADSIFGPKTESAVVGFQKEHGLKTDGIVGPRTWRALLAG